MEISFINQYIRSKQDNRRPFSRLIVCIQFSSVILLLAALLTQFAFALMMQMVACNFNHPNLDQTDLIWIFLLNAFNFNSNALRMYFGIRCLGFDAPNISWKNESNSKLYKFELVVSAFYSFHCLVFPLWTSNWIAFSIITHHKHGSTIFTMKT